MFEDDFFDSYLVTEGFNKTYLRNQVSKLMVGVITLSNERGGALPNAELISLTGLTRAQFYYAVKGIAGLWSYIFMAALNMRLTNPQRSQIISAAQTLDIPDRLGFPEALQLLIQKGYPIRQACWPSGYISVNKKREFFFTEENTGITYIWTASSAHMRADDWQIALPDRFERGS